MSKDSKALKSEIPIELECSKCGHKANVTATVSCNHVDRESALQSKLSASEARVKELEEERQLRVTYSKSDGFWLLIKSPSGKQACINLPSMSVYSIAYSALMEVAEKL